MTHGRVEHEFTSVLLPILKIKDISGISMVQKLRRKVDIIASERSTTTLTWSSRTVCTFVYRMCACGASLSHLCVCRRTLSHRQKSRIDEIQDFPAEQLSFFKFQIIFPLLATLGAKIVIAWLEERTSGLLFSQAGVLSVRRDMGSTMRVNRSKTNRKTESDMARHLLKGALRHKMDQKWRLTEKLPSPNKSKNLCDTSLNHGLQATR